MVVLVESCLDHAERLARAVENEAGKCDCMLLSGGVDTSFIATSHPDPQSVTAFTVDLGGPDAGYAASLAKGLGMSHIVVRPSPRLFKEALARAVVIVDTIDPVEAAADAVHVISIEAARSMGCRCLATGDGGDELFLGYTFLHDRSPGELKRWIEDMTREAWLPTIYIGGQLGMETVAPLYSDKAKRIALETPIDCLIGERGGARYGKFMLRLYLERKGWSSLAWRPKNPVTSGSGSLRMLKSIAKSMDAVVDEARLGFKPPSRLHRLLASLYLQRKDPPPPCSERARTCPVCGRCMSPRGHCRFCGAVKARGGVVMHYSGD